MKSATLILFALLSAFVLSCANPEAGREGIYTVAVLHTNDVHSEIKNFPKLAAYEKAIEKDYDEILLVSAGDLFSGNAYIDFYRDRGYPMIDLMNKVDYDLAVLGNHEFDYGQEIFTKRIEQAEFPFICANIKTRDENLPHFNPYKIINTKGIKLMFLGLLQTGRSKLPSTHPDNVVGFDFTPAEEVYGQYAYLKDSVDAFIGLTHLGYQRDKALAETSNLFDVILGGHSHTFIDTVEYVNSTLITQTGYDLEYVGKTVLTFYNGKLTYRDYEVIKLDTISGEDAELVTLVDGYFNNPELSKKIGTLVSPIEGEFALGCFFTDAQVYMQDIDFSFQNGGGLRVNKLDSGTITPANIYDLDPFMNTLVEFELSVPELKSLIGNSYQRSNSIDLYMGGGSYNILLDDNGALVAIEIETKNGIPLHKDSTYTVGLSSYIAANYTFDHADTGRPLQVTTADNLMEFVQQHDQIDYAGCVSATVNF